MGKGQESVQHDEQMYMKQHTSQGPSRKQMPHSNWETWGSSQSNYESIIGEWRNHKEQWISSYRKDTWAKTRGQSSYQNLETNQATGKGPTGKGPTAGAVAL